MTSRSHPLVEVTQADRQAAADFLVDAWGWSARQHREVLKGEHDQRKTVQAFSRYRLDCLADASSSKKVRQVPQAWIDRAMQIEAAADGLVSMVNDAIQRAQNGSGRLYSANIFQMEKWAAQVTDA